MEQTGPASVLSNSGNPDDGARSAPAKSTVESEKDDVEVHPLSMCAFVSYSASKKREFEVELMLWRAE
ncbi:hypothetical protein TRAPUB_11203 [Trametes pubescens]|uniref:Uncharacterized protein n=1 Tax=Trametes pubescens TaxID=154538 RepID=A0A1M2VXD2_TRAPU|nr:hypothetical protein TRAPUB_11203 [Trametes pubescens]